MKINPINRQIIYEGTSIDKYNETQNKLEDQNIDYDSIINEVDRDYPLNKGQEIGASRAEKMDLSKIYIIYIHKKDFNQAKDVLRENK